MKKIKVKNKTILVDDKDFKFVSKYRWYIAKIANKEYPMTERTNIESCPSITITKKQKYIKKDGTTITYKSKKERAFMHWMILGKKGVDHKNGNGLDNRRKNLRICSHSQNMCNRVLHKNNTSGYMGVWLQNRRKKWRAQIKSNNKKIYLGSYFTAKEAAFAYNMAAKKYHGEFASYNLFL